jgi:antagonist of KipI
MDTNPVLGSRSTYLPANFGGLEGRPLKKGDRIKISEEQNSQFEPDQTIQVYPWGVQVAPDNNPIRIFCGPDFERLTGESQRLLLEKNFKISPDSNRMGYRLSGVSLRQHNLTELISTPVTRGTIQLTHDGTPIVLLADAQTIGGYPRIAQVAEVDLPRLAQVRPGESIRFQLISYADACALFLARNQERKKTATAIALRLKPGW